MTPTKENATCSEVAGIAEQPAADSTTNLINCFGVYRTGKQNIDALKPEWCGRDGGAPDSKRNRLGGYLVAHGVAKPSDTAANLLNFEIDPDRPDHLAFIYKLCVENDPDAADIYKCMHTIYMISIYTPEKLGKLIGIKSPCIHFLDSNLPKLLAEKPNALLICTRCFVLCQAYEFGGAGHSEPLWFDMLKIVAKCVPDVSLEVSDGHAKYSLAELEGRRERIKRENLKPATCAHISEHSTLCGSCEWRGHINSPIALGYSHAPKKREVAHAH